jgi:hypothetical protein
MVPVAAVMVVVAVASDCCAIPVTALPAQIAKRANAEKMMERFMFFFRSFDVSAVMSRGIG